MTSQAISVVTQVSQSAGLSAGAMCGRLGLRGEVLGGDVEKGCSRRKSENGV